MLGGESYQYFYLDWYQIPRELGRPLWSEPYFDEGAGNIIDVHLFRAFLPGKRRANGNWPGWWGPISPSCG